MVNAGMRKLVAIAGPLCLAIALAACADGPGLPYPKLPDLSRVTDKVLTPSQQKKEIQDLTFEHERHEKAAVEEIEKGK